MKILVVEDDEDSRICLERVLKSQNYTVEGAANGVLALEKALYSLPDLIISDILMPEMDGFDLCRRVKANEKLQHIPFIFYTATFIDKRDEELAMSIGASRFIVKPIKMEEFFKIITDVIEEHKEKKLPVPEKTLVEIEKINEMYSDTISRKLDKKVAQLQKENAERNQATEALRQSEEKFSKAFNSTPDAIEITRISDERLIEVNEVFVRRSGYSRDEAVGHTTLEFNLWANPKDRERYFTTMREQGSVREQESQFRMKSGEILEGLVSGETFSMGEEKFILTIIRDITERKKAEEALKKSETSLKKAQELGKIGNWEFDLKTQKIDWSDEVYVLYERDKKLGAPSFGEEAKYYPPEVAKKLYELARMAMETGKDYRYDLTARLPSGRIALFNTSINPVKDDKGNVIKLLGTVQDITERKLTEEAMQKSEKCLREAQRIAHIGSWQWTKATDTVEWSEELYHINGLDPNSSAPSYAKLSSCYTPQSWKLLSVAVTKALQRGESYELDLDIVRPDGTIIHTSARGEADYDASGRIIGLHGTVQDITERKRAEEILRETERELNESQRVAQVGNWQWIVATDTITWSPGYYRIIGRDLALPPPNYTEHLKMYTDESAARLEAAVEESLKNGTPYELDLEMLHPNGVRRFMVARGEAVRDAAGHVAMLRGTLQDITQRKLAEEELLKIKLLLNETQRISRVGGWEYDVEKKRTTWTDEVYNIYGVSKDFDPNNINMAIEFYSPEDRNVITNAFDKAVNQGEPYDLELKFSSAKGQHLWIRTIGKPIMQDGKVVRVIGNIMDITELKRVEEELQEHREHLEELVKERTAQVKKKNEELERFNKLFVGRELRMVELKKRIMELEKKAQ